MADKPVVIVRLKAPKPLGINPRRRPLGDQQDCDVDFHRGQAPVDEQNLHGAGAGQQLGDILDYKIRIF